MPRYAPKEVRYPLTDIEYHIVTSTGVTSWITNSLELARDRILQSDPSFKLIAVKTMKHDITPRKPLRIVRTDDAPLAMSA